ncbi:alpha/beta fold hydrolase [Gloeocapsopsis dulcis]|nr:alpha/beta fold hydrolase [Gloeocapsopsis dulcis]WNN88257.1 condensation domain-containing protein [Gloeocapsopsis dulcis]
MNITSSVGLSGKNQASSHVGIIPDNQSQTETAQQLLWQSIRTVIGLQNQAPPLQPVSHRSSLPLSFPQERLWLIEHLKSGSSAYNIPFAFRITGSLKVSALEKSLNAVIRSHEILRTNFALVEGRAVQVIVPTLSLSIPVVNLQQLPKPEQEIQLMKQATAEAKQPFNLSCGPLLRAVLLHLDTDEYVLLLTIHHIVFDGWSEGILFRQLAAFYRAFSTSKPAPPLELSIQYADFAVWQRQWLQGEFLEVLLSYWKRQLDGKSQLQLPTDRPRLLVPTHHSSYQKLLLPQELTAALKALSRQHGVTLFTTLLAAFKLLVHCYTQQDDLSVCSPTANRNCKELKELIGYFVNLLILRSDLSGDPSFCELLGRVHQVVTGAYAYQDLPVQQLVSCVDSAQTSLFQVMFVLQNTPRQSLELPGLAVSSLDIDSGTDADFDLFLSMVEESGTLSGVLKYNTDLFDKATIIQMLKHFQSLLENIVANPGQSLSLLLPISETERQQLLDKQMNCHAVLDPKRLRTEQERSYIAPRNSLEFQLVQIWEQVLGIKLISVNDNFFELGGSSLVALQLFTQIEKVFGKNLPLTTLLQSPTVEQLAASFFSLEKESVSWSSLVPIQSSGSKPPFFCVHGLRGGTLGFRNLANHLGSEQPIYGLEARGLDGKHAPFTQVEQMAAFYIKEIRRIQPNGPYFLGGYSFGGTVAFEMAQQLYKQGQKIALLSLFDTYGPSCFKQLSLLEKLSRHWHNLLRFRHAYVRTLVKKRVLQLSQKIAIKFYQSLGYTLSYKLRKANLEAIHNRVQRNYVPQVYPGRVTLFRAINPLGKDFYYEPDLPTPDDWYNRDPEHGWAKLAAGGLEIHDVPGNHMAIFTEPYVGSLAEKLKACLEQE